MSRRRDFVSSLAALGPLAALASAQAGGKPPRLPNATLLPKDAKPTKEPFGDLLVYFDGPTDQLSSMTAGSLRLNAGAEPHPPHEHPEEEFMLVTEGTGFIMVDGKTSNVGPGAMMYCAANKLHHIKSTGKTPLMFYFWKWKA